MRARTGVGLVSPWRSSVLSHEWHTRPERLPARPISPDVFSSILPRRCEAGHTTGPYDPNETPIPVAKLYRDDSVSPLSRPIRWYTLFNGLELNKWYTYDWMDRVQWERDSVLFDRPGLCRAEVKGGYWDHYVLCAEVLTEQGAGGWYSVQLTAGEATALCRLQPDEVVVDYLQKHPLPSGDCATRICRAGSQPYDTPNGRWVELQIQVQNDLLTASVDGRRMVTATIPVGLAGLPGFIVQVQGECRVRLRSVRIAFLPPPTHAQRLIYGSLRPVHSNGRVHVPFWDHALVHSRDYWLADLQRIAHHAPAPPFSDIEPAEHASNTVFLAGSRVYKILSRDGSPEAPVRSAREAAVLRHLSGLGHPVPSIHTTGCTSVRAGHDLIVRSRLPGDTWHRFRSHLSPPDAERCAQQLGPILAALHRFDRPSCRCFELSDAACRRRMERTVTDAIRLWGAREGQLVREKVDEYVAHARASAGKGTSGPCIVHGALDEHHVLVVEQGRRRSLSGIVGFGSVDTGYAEEDLAHLHLVLFDRDVRLTNAFLRQYRASGGAPLSKDRCRLHTALIVPTHRALASAVAGKLRDSPGAHGEPPLEHLLDRLWTDVDV